LTKTLTRIFYYFVIFKAGGFYPGLEMATDSLAKGGTEFPQEQILPLEKRPKALIISTFLPL